MTPTPERHREGATLSVAVEPAQLEEAFSRIPGIEAARVVQGPGGVVSEVHVLASRERSPKQLVRDIQSVSMASFEVDIDYRKISIVQLEDALPGGATTTTERPSVRPAVVRMTSELEGQLARVEVVLTDGERVGSGSAQGPATAGMRLVAKAVLAALGNIGHGVGAEADFAEVVAAGQRQAALVVLRVGTPRGEHIVSGSAVLRNDPTDAVARATLSALNRFLDV